MNLKKLTMQHVFFDNWWNWWIGEYSQDQASVLSKNNGK